MPLPEERSVLARFPFYARLALILLAVTIIGWGAHAARPVAIPFFFAVLISFLLLPMCNWLEARRFSRGVAAGVSILAFVLFITLIIYLLVDQIGAFARSLPDLQGKAESWVSNVQDFLVNKYGINMKQQAAYADKAANTLADTATLAAPIAVAGILGVAIWTIFVIIFTFFILTHRTQLRRFIIALFETRERNRVMEVLSETRVLANGYVVGLMMEMLIVAILNSLLLWAFGIKYALLLGVMTAVLNIIPFLGFYTGTALSALVTLADSTPGAALTVAIILIVIHFVDANILLPRVVGSKVKLNPLVTILAVLTGSLIWGIPGTFLFIPLVAMLKLVFERVDGLKPWGDVMDVK